MRNWFVFLTNKPGSKLSFALRRTSLRFHFGLPKVQRHMANDAAGGRASSPQSMEVYLDVATFQKRLQLPCNSGAPYCHRWLGLQVIHIRISSYVCIPKQYIYTYNPVCCSMRALFINGIAPHQASAEHCTSSAPAWHPPRETWHLGDNKGWWVGAKNCSTTTPKQRAAFQMLCSRTQG